MVMRLAKLAAVVALGEHRRAQGQCRRAETDMRTSHVMVRSGFAQPDSIRR
jgi:hypothetical protein